MLLKGNPVVHSSNSPTPRYGGSLRFSNQARMTFRSASFTIPPRATPRESPSRTIRVKNCLEEVLVGKFLDTKSEEVVIFCHGYASTKKGCHFERLAEELAKKNISSIRFDFSGNGESDGCFEFGNYRKEVEDIRSIVQYVWSLRKKVFALIGHSKGGDDVLLYASQYDDVPYIINIAGRFDLKAGIDERFGEKVLKTLEKVGEVPQITKTSDGQVIEWVLTKRSLEERRNLDMPAAVTRISLSEVLTIHGSGDRVVKVEDAHKFSHAIKTHTLCIVDGADHNFRGAAHADQLVRKVVDFLTNGL